jgi:hypothetical protein
VHLLGPFEESAQENTEPVAPSSTTPASFPPGLAASAYDPQEWLQPRSTPCSVHGQPMRGSFCVQGALAGESRNERTKPRTRAATMDGRTTRVRSSRHPARRTDAARSETSSEPARHVRRRDTPDPLGALAGPGTSRALLSAGAASARTGDRRCGCPAGRLNRFRELRRSLGPGERHRARHLAQQPPDRVEERYGRRNGLHEITTRTRPSAHRTRQRGGRAGASSRGRSASLPLFKRSSARSGESVRTRRGLGGSQAWFRSASHTGLGLFESGLERLGAGPVDLRN